MPRSLGARFLAVVIVVTGAFSAAVTTFSWVQTREHTRRLLAAKGELALHFDLAIREYVAETIRPFAESRLGREDFLPEVMSTSYVARSIFDKVRERRPGYIVKFSSDNPRNPANLAGPEELEILRYFREHPEAASWSGSIRIDGREYEACFSPRRMEKSCLRCHGEPADAPASLRRRYGDAAAFHRPVGEVMAMDVVAIPVEEHMAAARGQAARSAVVILAGIGVLAGAVLGAFHLLVGRRLKGISSRLRAAAEVDAPTEVLLPEEGGDEIGLLAASYNALAERLRRAHEELEERVRARTEELSRATEGLRRMQSAVDRASEAIFWTDASGRFRYVNDAACRGLGYSREELLRLGVQDVDPEFPAERWPEHWRELALRGSLEFETRHRRKDGSMFPVEVTANYFEFEGQAYNFAFARDITRRKESERLLQDSNQRLSEALSREMQALVELQETVQQLHAASREAQVANQAKSEFLANMSHEIRTPMTAILGYCEQLLDEDLSETERREALETVRRNGHHLLSIINDILDLSKIEAGRMTVEQRRCSPRSLIDEVAATIRGRAAAKGLAFRVDYAGPVPETIESDTVRLRQILINLLGNAVKFTERGEVAVRVRLEAGPPARLAIEVADTGIGMTPDQIARIAEPFTQGDASTVRRFGGTGLGLAISSRLARLLGGQLTVLRSEPGRGTTFGLWVPTGDLNGVRMIEGAGTAAPVAAAVAESAGSGRLGGRILLAEDGVDNQRLLSHLLRKAGAEVEVAENGAEALACFGEAAQRGQPFGLVFMDMQMPVMDGYQATRALRRAGFRGPIVALTAHAMTGDREKCLAAGCDDYLTKPVDRQTLLNMARRYLKPAVAAVGAAGGVS